jgi:hypothetical protein
MYAAKAGHSTLGIPKKVGAEFIAASHGITDLPKRKKQAGAHHMQDGARPDWGGRSTRSRADVENFPSFGRLSR